MTLTDDELLELLRNLESDRVERKASATDGDKICQAICAFANDMPGHAKPGVLFVGENDKGGPSGTVIDDELLRTLAAKRGDGNTLPIPALTVEKRRLAGHEYAVVTVQPAAAPPVRFKGVPWIRVGPSRRTASAQEEQILAERRRSRDLPFDLHPFPSATLGDLSKRLFEEDYLPQAFPADVIEANGRSYEEKLRALRLVGPSGAGWAPTAVGLLVLAPRVRDFLPGAYVQFLRIEGTGLFDPIRDEAVIDGPLAQMLTALDNKLKAHIHVGVDLTTESRELRAPNYPREAVEQIVRNAVMHRNYNGTNTPVRVTWFDDRIEILSPGGPYGIVTAEDFGRPGVTDYRNPSIAEAMKTLGFVQRFGVGIATANKRLVDNGNGEIVWEIQPNFVLAKIKARS